MPTKYAAIFEELMADFHPDEVKVRENDGARFAKARTYMNRLDKVLGPENWEDVYKEERRGISCMITVGLPGGELVRKSGIAAFSPISPVLPNEPKNGDVYKANDQIKLQYEATAAEAFKRAAVKFGVGRYLYNDGIPILIQAEAQPTVQRVSGGVAEPPMSVGQLAAEMKRKAAHVAWKNPATGQPLGETLPAAVERPTPVKAWDPKQLEAIPEAGTVAVFDWVRSIGLYYEFDAMAAVNKVVREKNLEPDCRKWDKATVERFCKFLKAKAAKSVRYQAENPVATPATELKRAVEESRAIAEAVTGSTLDRLRAKVQAWAIHLALKGKDPSETFSVEQVAELVLQHSGYQIADLDSFDVASVLQSTITSLQEAGK